MRPDLGALAPLWLSADDQNALVSIGACADALAEALAVPATDVGMPDPPRMALALPDGQLLVMPSAATGRVGVKLVTVADTVAHPAAPRIQGVHVQFDVRTLAPRALLDAPALTCLRTAAISVVALRRLADPASSDLLVFGAGPQALSHVRGIAAEWPIRRVRVASRTADSARRAADALRPGLPDVEVGPLPARDVEDGVAAADIVVCATTSAVPLFAGTVRPGAAVVAVGSHSAVERELPGRLVQRAFVVVEDRGVALREAGDITMAIAEGLVAATDIAADLGEIVRGADVDVSRPRVFKSVGMAWQDAVVAEAILARAVA